MGFKMESSCPPLNPKRIFESGVFGTQTPTSLKLQPGPPAANLFLATWLSIFTGVQHISYMVYNVKQNSIINHM